MNAREWAFLLFLSLIWGGSFFFVGVAVKALPPMTIVFLRCFIAAAVLLVAVLTLRKRIPLSGTALLTFGVMGLINNVIPQSLIVWSQGYLPSGYAAILNATTPFFAVMILHAFTDNDRTTPAKTIGVIIGFAGVAVMIGLSVLEHSGSLWPQIALLVSSFFYGLSGLWGRRFAALGVPPFVAATGQLLASSLMLLPLALLFEQPLKLPMPDVGVWMALLGLGVISTALAYVVYFRILATAGASNLSLVTLLIPVSAILFGVLFLHETIQIRHLIGMAMIGLGLACIDGRPLRRLGLIR
jgi:drug/metabolite transporter (DMT)-like permease